MAEYSGGLTWIFVLVVAHKLFVHWLVVYPLPLPIHDSSDHSPYLTNDNLFFQIKAPNTVVNATLSM